MQLGPDGRLVREGLALEMNAYCRRAVAQGIEIAAAWGGTCTVFTLGPPAAEDCLREAIVCGADNGVLITDPAFAGSDTLATARALAAALEHEGPFDLVLAGRNSIDADTGQVGPELAELLDLPFASCVRELELAAGALEVVCEHDDEWVTLTLPLPAVASVAERLIEPCKGPDAEARAAVAGSRLRTLGADDLGVGPWGQAGSPTTVGAVREVVTDRLELRPAGSMADQIRRTVEVLVERGALGPTGGEEADGSVAPAQADAAETIAVVVEPDRGELSRELLGAAARMGAVLPARVAAVVTEDPEVRQLSSWGASEVVVLRGTASEEDVATGLANWAAGHGPWAVLVGGTLWGREVAARVAATLGAGLTGDAVGLVITDGRLEAAKPAFGGRLVAAIMATSPIQMATVRRGVLARLSPRAPAELAVSSHEVTGHGRVRVHERRRADDAGLLATADVVVGIGQGIDPQDYPRLDPLLDCLGAELAATRKVTDRGWMPRARQLGITGRSIAPRLYVALALGGKFNHSVGVRGAGTIVAVNTDPDAPIFDWADVGLVGDWREIVPEFVAALEALRARS